MKLDNKTAVITGSTSAFGHVIARGYVKEGADVLLQDWPEAGASSKLCKRNCARSGGGWRSARRRSTRLAGATELAADAIKAFGKIDILVNTTGGGDRIPFFESTEARFRSILDRGVVSYYLTCQHVGKEMARVGSGKIVNLTSIVGKLGGGGAIGWGADRGGVDAMTAALAQALGPYGINVVALARGGTDTTEYTDAAITERIRRLPFGRLGREDDIVGPAIFLATDDARWITGTVVYCDGGYTTAAVTDDEDRPKEIPYRGK